ncbi:MAG TPA: PAS domain-containing sensor histidine kinase [Candidatus Thalassarchaeaceae archaeon]|nr:PAS domain-containing sensor histidine kinase [Candidatus Thalassarchaeaceae archaeon]HJM19324.1 PAS domain-containing sensor histidine kinase [Candidatus Thalassarchaeaceae archaeon]
MARNIEKMTSDTPTEQEQLLDALHQRGEQLSNILSSINAAVAVTDINGYIVLLNDVARTKLGLIYSPELTLAGYASQFDWRDGKGSNFTSDNFPVSSVLSGGPAIHELPVSKGNGEDARHFRLSATPLTSREGELVGAVVVFHEVTELVRLQTELQEMNEQRLGFYSGMSHELRTPLQGIIGYTDLLLEESEEGSFEQESLEAIRSSTDHLLSIVTDLLDLSKIVAGRMELNKSPTLLTPIIKEALSMVSPAARKKSVSLKSNLENLGILEIDERAIRQVILNLVSNAIKYTDEGGEVVISSEITDDIASILVRDTGTGISEGDQELIFREFVQVKGADGRQRAGTGLGLALSKHFVDMHGGTLVVISKVGVGSTFIINLPVN